MTLLFHHEIDIGTMIQLNPRYEAIFDQESTDPSERVLSGLWVSIICFLVLVSFLKHGMERV